MKKEFKATLEYTIAAKASGLLLEVVEGNEANGTAVCLAPADGSTKQLWKIKQDKDLCQIFSKATGKCLDVIDGGTEDGAWIHQWENLSAPNQVWTAEAVSEGVYKLKNSGKCLDVVGMSAVEGAHVQLWSDVDGENQQWVITAVEKKPAAKKAETAEKKPAAKKATKKAEKAESVIETVVKAELPAAVAPASECAKAIENATLAAAPAKKGCKRTCGKKK